MNEGLSVTEDVTVREPATAAEEYLPKSRRKGIALCLSGEGIGRRSFTWARCDG